MTNTLHENTFDVVGIGFGPANIALAIAAEELGLGLKIKFLERNPAAGWQDEMMLPDSDIQNHPLRDLVTPRNPRSKYTFVNFLFEQNRLFEHLNLPLQHPLRIEYRQYVVWVASHFSHLVEYDSEVEAIQPVMNNGSVTGYEVVYNGGRKIFAGSLVVAPGRTPHIPPEFENADDQRVVHLTRFLGAFNEVQKRVPAPRIAILGGSQSAVELLLYASGRIGGGKITGINRNFGFRLKDTSPFSDEVYFPSFVETYFNASKADKTRLRKELAFTNYSASDRDVLDALYVTMYRQKIQNQSQIELKHLTQVTSVTNTQEGICLTLKHAITKAVEHHSFDLVVLATGFRDLGDGPQQEPYPQLLGHLSDHLHMEHGAMTVDIDYRVKLKNERECRHAPLFLNGLCESSHGMGDAGSFSLLSLRAAAIVKAILAHFSNASAMHPSTESNNEDSQDDVSLLPVS
ncbi:SidA/IucD/PvdA family monooxygenase [Noviherbaspirillum sp. ST9]|uniref:SidA/IucD/PvdA family monooxygenase n=1 Tax=Noviherbaspirillum sp. ST9 TaxID=3401606 RepID=UPI003B589894